MFGRLINYDKDYEDIASWWKQWGWTVLPREVLPETGIIIENQGVKICAAFIYKTDSRLCSAEWFISNKKAPSDLRGGAVAFLIKEIISASKQMGFMMILTNVKRDSLIDKLVGAGFSKGDSGFTTLMRVL